MCNLSSRSGSTRIHHEEYPGRLLFSNRTCGVSCGPPSGAERRAEALGNHADEEEVTAETFSSKHHQEGSDEQPRVRDGKPRGRRENEDTEPQQIQAPEAARE